MGREARRARDRLGAAGSGAIPAVRARAVRSHPRSPVPRRDVAHAGATPATGLVYARDHLRRQFRGDPGAGSAGAAAGAGQR